MYKCRYCVLNTGYWVLELTNVVYLFPWKQADNGLPVHIKGGTVDVLMYRATMTLTMAGNSLSYLFTYSSIIFIDICLLSIHLYVYYLYTYTSIIYTQIRILSIQQYVYIIHMHMSIIYIHICLLSIHLYVYYLYTYTSIIYIHMSFNYTPICILSIYI